MLSTVAVLFTFPDRKITSPTFTSVIKLVPLPVKKVAVLDTTLSVEVPLTLCVTMFNEKGLTVKSPEASNVLLAMVFSISPNTGYLISSGLGDTSLFGQGETTATRLANNNLIGGGGRAGNSDNSKNSGTGGSGIVIIRFPSTVTITIGGSLTSSSSTQGSDTVVQFTAGSDNVSFA